MQGPVVSTRKIQLISNMFYFDMFSFKKYQQCCVKIPDTVILEKGFVKQWLFNSSKLSGHPILKKKRQNMTPIAVVKQFCQKLGYGSVIHSCVNIQQIRDQVKAVLKQQKDYDFAKDKKVFQVITITNQVLSMSLTDFLDFVAQNKYAQQQFYQKWKIIQQKCSGAKIDEFYEVQNIRHNHIIESKCKKIISLNTTQSHIVSTQIENDPYKKSSPSRNFQISETKQFQGYKFFDTFLNKKFFRMSHELIEFIQKNYKCIVESINTKFVINKDRQPHLVAAYDLQIKPAKKITQMKQFLIAKQKGNINIDDYMRFLEIYISQNMEKLEHYDLNTPINQRRRKCKGKFCKIPLEDSNLPPMLQQKLKMPTLPNARVISSQLKDAVLKRRRRVLQNLIQNKVIEQDCEILDQSSEYESGQEEEPHPIKKNKQIKVCQNCFNFYFHINRFYQLDMYGNLIEKKAALMPVSSQKKLNVSQSTLPPINFRKPNLTSPVKKIDDQDSKSFEISPTKVQQSTNQKMKNYTRSQSNSKFQGLTRQKTSIDKNKSKLKTQRKISGASMSKVKLDPLSSFKKIPIEEGTEKGNRLINLTKLSQPIKLKERNKPQKSQQILPLRERRPQNHEQAIQQLVRKLSSLSQEDRDLFIILAKKYYRDNLPQPIDRRCFSNHYYGHIYEFMNNSPIILHPKQRIKKRPQMSLKRLSQLSDYPQIVSRSEFIFDTLIINQQTTIPFCIITTKVVNPDNIRTNMAYQNIIIVNDIFDSFIEHISTAKQILQEDQIYNKRIILFNYAGQSHTIYNQSNIHNYSIYFSEILDKLLFRLSMQKNQLKIIDLEKDRFKFMGFGYGAYLLAQYIGHSYHYYSQISGVMLINSYMKMPIQYRNTMNNLLTLYQTDDPTVENEPFLYYNKAINSEQVSIQQMQHKSGLNSIKIEDRIYLLKSMLKQINVSETQVDIIQPLEFQEFTECQVSIVYGKKNNVIPKQSNLEYLTYRKNKKQEIPNRVFIEIDGGHDILADNYDDITRVITLFCRK